MTLARPWWQALLCSAWRAALDALAPVRCAACSAKEPEWEPFCDACAKELRPCSEPSRALAPYWFGGPLRTALHQLKYQGRADLGPRLGRMLCDAAEEQGPFDAIVPIPLTHARLVERGYNQAALLAREVARQLGCPLITDRLARRRFAGSQTKLARAERSENVRGAFQSRPLQGRVLLIDDVTTTGATFAEAAQALREAGASEVVALALCRTP